MEQEAKEQSASPETRHDATVITPSQGEMVEAPPTQEMPCSTCASEAAAASYVYAIGRVEARFPYLAGHFMPRRAFLPLAGATALAMVGCTAAPRSSDLAKDVTFTDHVHVMALLDNEGRAVRRVAPNAHLDYHGGKVIQNVHVTQVLYGSGTYISQLTSTSGVNMASAYDQMLTSGVFDWLSEYDTASPAQTIGRGSFGSSVQITPDMSRNGSTLSDANIQSELAAQIDAGSLPAADDNQIYMVSFPSEKSLVTTQGSSCVDFCAYHGTFKIAGQNVYYAVLPALTVGGCDTGCGGGTTFENQQSVASHELIEAVTDAEVSLASMIGPPLAWYDDTLGEIGDICNQQQTTFLGSDGNLYTIQKEFSNQQKDCVSTVPDFRTFVQDYAALDFGLPSSWEPITGDFNGDKITDYARLAATGAWVFVANPSSGNGAFNDPVFQDYTHNGLNFGDPATNWPTITGDFDHDGNTDYARVGSTGAWVFIANPSNGNGGFNDPVFQDYTHNGLNFGDPATNWPTITGDFDRDGNTDYARVGSTGAWVFIANPSNGNGGFNDPVFQDYTHNGLNFGDPATNWPTITGDFDNDGNTDYARVGSTGAWVFLANPSSGNGGFKDPVFQDYDGLNFGDPATNWQTITGDFDNDGNTDYARVGSTGAWVFFANPSSGNGGFNVPVFQDYDGLNFGDPATNWQTITGDFNGDGNTDYLRAGSTGAWVFSANAGGIFTQTFQIYPSPNFGDPSPWQVVTGEFTPGGKTSYARLGGTRAIIFGH